MFVSLSEHMRLPWKSLLVFIMQEPGRILDKYLLFFEGAQGMIGLYLLPHLHSGAKLTENRGFCSQ